jgi:hypothetical protein
MGLAGTLCHIGQVLQGDPGVERRGRSFGVSLEATVSRISAERLKVRHPVLVLFK